MSNPATVVLKAQSINVLTGNPASEHANDYVRITRMVDLAQRMPAFRWMRPCKARTFCGRW